MSRNDGPGSHVARVFVLEGLIDEEQLAYANRVHSKLPNARPLTQVVTELYDLDDDQVRKALGRHRTVLRLGHLLVELGHLTQDDLSRALAIQKREEEEHGQSRRLGEILVAHHFVSESELVDLLSLQLSIPVEEPELSELTHADAPRLPVQWCLEHGFVPLREEENGVVVAFSDPTNQAAFRAAEETWGRGRVVPVLSRRSVIDDALHAIDPKGIITESEQLDDSAIVDAVDTLLRAAVDRAASDIHVEPRKDRLTIRFRIDGVLMHYRDFPRSMATAISSRIKVLCGADIAERRRHQGGRFYYEWNRHEIDLRVSMYVTVHGEKIVMRLLNHDRKLVGLDTIAMGPAMLNRFREDALLRPSGVLMITGPTGSGKTTTLYSCVNEIRDSETSIITAEDPVEYVIDGIAQCSINPAIDLSFEETLRHIVRQDPDVIVIGEIRDNFSADVAVQAALTGHKVLTTFHTEDTIGGLIRLLNMNVEAFLVSSTVVSVLAQRLLRRVCTECSVPYEPTPADLRRLGYGSDAVVDANFCVGRGCSACRQTGYSGRIAAFELLVLDAAVRDAILTKKTSQEIRRISRESTGLVSLLEDGIAKAAVGLTTISEVVRMLPRLDPPRSLSELRRLIGNVQ